MKIGYTVWTWLSDEFNNWEQSKKPKADFEQALREISDLGYQTVENFNWFAECYEDDIEGFKAVLDKYNLEFVNLYHYFSGNFEEDYKKAERYCKFLQKAGVKLMNLQGILWMDKPFIRSLDLAALKVYAEESNRIGKMSQEYGVTICMHPHSNTSIFHEDEIDCFLENTDPKYVSLALDTAHTALAGIDPVKAFDKYYDRLRYVHLKDIDPNTNAHPEWPMRRFLALGQGCIDFKGIVNVLKKKEYDGVLCVELDYQRVCNYESAQYSRNYIKNVLGM